MTFARLSADERRAQTERELERLAAEAPAKSPLQKKGLLKKNSKLAKQAEAAAEAAREAQVDAQLDALDAPPKRAENFALWLKWQKREWRRQRTARAELRKRLNLPDPTAMPVDEGAPSGAAVGGADAQPAKLSAAIQAHPQLVHDWEIIEVSPAVDIEWLLGKTANARPSIRAIPSAAGEFNVWAIIQGQVRLLRLTVPRRFYVNRFVCLCIALFFNFF